MLWRSGRLHGDTMILQPVHLVRDFAAYDCREPTSPIRKPAPWPIMRATRCFQPPHGAEQLHDLGWVRMSGSRSRLLLRALRTSRHEVVDRHGGARERDQFEALAALDGPALRIPACRDAGSTKYSRQSSRRLSTQNSGQFAAA